MSAHTEIPPDTLAVDLTAEGVEVEYTDGRQVFYRGVPEPVTGEHTTAPGKDVHVLVTNAEETHGVLTYVNERTTEDEILEDAGVGRVLLAEEETASIYPGVEVSNTGLRIRVDADRDQVDGRIFVFEEDARGERSVELVSDENSE